MEVPIIMPEKNNSIAEPASIRTIRKLFRSLKSCRWPFLLFLVVFILAYYCEAEYSGKIYGEKDIQMFQKILTS